MGNNTGSVLQPHITDPNIKPASFASLKSDKPSKKTVFQYISPVLGEEGEEVGGEDEQENAITSQMSRQLNEDEYRLMEQGEV